MAGFEPAPRIVPGGTTGDRRLLAWLVSQIAVAKNVTFNSWENPGVFRTSRMTLNVRLEAICRRQRYRPWPGLDKRPSEVADPATRLAECVIDFQGNRMDKRDLWSRVNAG